MTKPPINMVPETSAPDNRRLRLTEEQREEVRRRLADPNPVMATEEEVEAVLRRYGQK